MSIYPIFYDMYLLLHVFISMPDLAKKLSLYMYIYIQKYADFRQKLLISTSIHEMRQNCELWHTYIDLLSWSLINRCT